MPYNAEHPENSGVLYDEQGRPYTLMADGKGGYKKNYISPVAMGGQAPEDTTSIFHARPQWNTETAQWDTPFDWGNLLNLGVGAGLGAGAASAAGLFGGGAASAPAASSASPFSAAANAAAGDIGAGAGAGAAGMGVMDLAKLAVPGVARLLTQRGSGASSNNPAGNVDLSQLQALLKLATERAQRTVPVHEAAMKLAMSLQPNLSANPRLGAANQAAMSQRPTSPLDPQVADAVARLMGRG